MDEKVLEDKEKKEMILEEKKEVRYDPNNIWLFTSKSAVDSYRRRGQLDELARDIRSSVMGGKSWRPEDIEYLREIQTLVDEEIVEEEASRWAVSPFPPVYKALRSGEMAVAGKKYSFKKGEQIVFQCRMMQEMKGLSGPVLIGNFSPAKNDRFCGDMSGRMSKMDEEE